MPDFINYNDPAYKEAAAEILHRHDQGAAEANITSAIRHFLVVTGLAKNEEINEENPPSDTSRRAVDLTALDTFIEVKVRVGLGQGINPNPEFVNQLDDYLVESQKAGKGARMGVLTDGKHWILRWPGAGAPKLSRPYVFILDNPDRWIPLYEWLKKEALVSLENITPSREAVESHFGPRNPHYQRDIDALGKMYREYANHETIKVKRRLWHDLLRTALGEIARETGEMDDLFVRHTYLTAVIGMVVQAYFGIDIRQLAETDPESLLDGRNFRSKTGLLGVVESDFFSWPAQIGGIPLLKTIARRVAKVDWRESPIDIASVLYETVIPRDERRILGEYYTPSWLARSMIQELVADPLGQTILDPACGSGTFVAEAVAYVMEAAAKNTELDPREKLEWLRISVSGIDIHPVAVHLARASWVIAARPAIQSALDHGFDSSITVPIYLGDSLQLRYRAGDIFSENAVMIPVEQEQDEEPPQVIKEGRLAYQLVFPMKFVERAEEFDAFMSTVVQYIESGDDPYLALEDAGVTDLAERQTLRSSIDVLRQLHFEGRNHIWAYYSRNLVRPLTLARKKVDVIVGNPPWINYNKTADILRAELELQSRNVYGIWQGGRYATHQDVAGLFFARCVDLYLKDDGLIGMVMPHSALQTGQYSKWRTGRWTSRRKLSSMAVDFTYKTAWDLERLEPNTFFPIPASVVFAKRLGAGVEGKPLSGEVERWRGVAGSSDTYREKILVTDTSATGDSSYADHSKQGATIVPRRLFFVEEIENTAIISAAQTITVRPRLGSNDKPPWNGLDLTSITGQTIENQHIFDVHLGETIAPYVTLEPLKVALPLKRTDTDFPADPEGVGGIRPGGLMPRMRDRWGRVSSIWEDNKASANQLDLLGQLDYYGKLTAQLEWQKSSGGRPVRIAYTEAGVPTASLLTNDAVLTDSTLYWIVCTSTEEAYYLLAIVNSDVLFEAVAPLMAKGQFGARHVHKHLWKLPIPEFDAANALHAEISESGRAAAESAAVKLEQIRQEHGPSVSVAKVRSELRKWLRSSPQGKAVEDAATRLLK